MKRTHLICNAHLDPVWLWEWEEGLSATLATFRTAADLCEEFDGFIFNHNEALLYQWVQQYEPALFERIRGLVRSGKWHIMGGWYLQPDCNMPSGESFVRQILTGKRYFQHEFGVDVTTAINFDPFGHTRGLVQLLAKSGYDSYLFCRPSRSWLKLPSDTFVWSGYDGSEVLACRASSHYNSKLGEARKKVEKWLADHPDDPLTIVLWGVGNHGGGPSRQDLRDLAGLMTASEGRQIIHSTPQRYFAELSADRAQLPRWENDLNLFAVGCYTSMALVKQGYRRLENQYFAVEKMTSAAAANGLIEYPRHELDVALKAMMFCQFHDILPGSGIPQVEQTSLMRLNHGLQVLSQVRSRAFFAMSAGQPPAKEGQVPILVYNPHPYKVRATVECEFLLPVQDWPDQERIEPFAAPILRQGRKRIASQAERESSNVNLDWHKRLVFTADLEPGQINRFDCDFEVLPRKPEPTLKARNGKLVFKTPQLQVIINTRTGLVDRYRIGGRDPVRPGAFAPIVMRDNEDPWGWQVNEFRDVEGRFKLMSARNSARFSGVRAKSLPAVRVIEDGELRTVIEAVFAYKSSAICQRYKLPKHGTEIEVETRVLWNEKDRMLKLAVPVAHAGARYLGQVAFGVQELPTNGLETVSHKWSAVVDDRRKLALTCINDCIYGSDFDGQELRLSLLRSPAYSAFRVLKRELVVQDRFTPRMDQGERIFHFWFNGGPARQRLDAVDREALVHNETPYALSIFPSGQGTLPQPSVILSDAIVQVSAVKLAEDDNSLIVRLFEPTGRPRSTELSIPLAGLRQRIDLRGFEIKTLRIDLTGRTVNEVTLLEQPLTTAHE